MGRDTAHHHNHIMILAHAHQEMFLSAQSYLPFYKHRQTGNDSPKRAVAGRKRRHAVLFCSSREADARGGVAFSRGIGYAFTV
jgi:hypothetical protein